MAFVMRNEALTTTNPEATMTHHHPNLACQRCDRDGQPGSRRSRCGTCSRLCCSHCCHRSGSGQGQGSRRWSECWDCQRDREDAPTTRRDRDRAAREDARRMARARAMHD